MQVSIEKYQDKDFKDVISLLVSSFESKFFHRQKLKKEQIEDILCNIWDIKADEPGYLNIVAKADEKILGVILIRYGQVRQRQKKIPFFTLSRKYGFFNMLLFICKLSMLDTADSHECYIEHIAVDKCMRGKGIGEQLMSFSEEQLISMGFKMLSLAVAANNPAKHLYSRKGFIEVEHVDNRIKEFFTGIREWAFMRKKLV